MRKFLNHCGAITRALFLVFLLLSCNSVFSLNFTSTVTYTSEGWEKKVREYSALIRHTNEFESFMFFTDPHIFGGENWRQQCDEMLEPLSWVYAHAPVEYCICGGDFLTGAKPYNENITGDEACYYLQYADRTYRKVFGDGKFLPVVGNHDLNYQGVDELNPAIIASYIFRDKGRCYYVFKGNTADVYVLDTGRNWVRIDGKVTYNVPMDVYKWTQIDWLARELKKNNNKHNIVVMHILLNNDKENKKFCLFEKAETLCDAYNKRLNIEMNNIKYDFSTCTGKVEFFLGGHLHRDIMAVQNKGIPYVLRKNFLPKEGNVPSFDCVFCDWDNRKVFFERFGEGQSSELALQ